MRRYRVGEDYIDVDEDSPYTLVIAEVNINDDGSSGASQPVMAIDLRENVVVAGFWPDDEEWVEVLEVDPDDPSGWELMPR